MNLAFGDMTHTEKGWRLMKLQVDGLLVDGLMRILALFLRKVEEGELLLELLLVGT